MIMAGKSMLKISGRQLLRLALFTLPVVLAFCWTSPGEAYSPGLQQATGSPALAAETITENSRSVAAAPGPATDAPGVLSAGTDTGGVAGKAGRKDLTVFFSIGVIVDILLVTAFLVWAVGQWSKTKKQEPKDHA
jgi:hypothetical protein